MYNLIQKQSSNGNRNFCATVYPSHSEALEAGKKMLENFATIEVMIVEQKTELKRAVAVEIITL